MKIPLLLAASALGFCVSVRAADPTLNQLPKAMHVEMKDRPRVLVGAKAGDVVGSDNRALQAAVDYIAGLGGGVVEIGEGTFTMRDSLHLRSRVTVKGAGAKTILKKAKGYSAKLKLDGDYGEEQFTVADATGFEVGDGVAIWDNGAGGFHTTVARITGRAGNTFAISFPLNADCMADNGGRAATVFPLVSGYNLEDARVEDLTVDGNKDENVYLNGCRGGGIFLYRCPGAVIERCIVRNFNGDGISFQQCNDVMVTDCVSEGNAGLGLHPGSGSQRPTVRNCIARTNGEDGLYLCWRVKYGIFEDNLLEGNGRYGISIGHKDTDNLLRKNQIRGNQQAGIAFRNESEGMAGHRNRIEENLIENNGSTNTAPAIHIRGETHDLVIKNNVIRDTRAESERKQSVGIQLEEKVGSVVLEGNQISAKTEFADGRKK